MSLRVRYSIHITNRKSVGGHRPAHGESAQDCARDRAFLDRDQREGGEEDGRNKPRGQREGHYPTQASRRTRLIA